MNKNIEVSARSGTDVEHQSKLSSQLNARLDDAQRLAEERFDSGQRAGGFGAVGRYFLTFLLTGLIKGKLLHGRQGVIACSIAAQDAYNHHVMTCLLYTSPSPRD